MKSPLISATDMEQDEEAFPRLNDEEIAIARSCGRAESCARDTVLFEPGTRPVDFFVVVSGRLAIVDTSLDDERLIVVHGAGSIIGDLNVFTGRPAVLRAQALEEMEVIRLTVLEVRKLLVRAAELSEKWINALLRRREMLIAKGFEGLRVFGCHDDSATLHVREFMHRNGVPHRWFDIAAPENAPLIASLQPPSPKYPAIVWGHEVLAEDPVLGDLAKRLGVQTDIPDELYDTVIIGSGPAGLGAAVYAASEGLRTLVLDRVGPGGQAGSSSRIENFVGFPSGISGRDLAQRSYVQALKFGATFCVPVNVADLWRDDEHLRIALDSGVTVRAKTAIISTGVTYSTLGVRGLSDLHGAGIYYSATQVEALLCEHQPVHIIGAGNSAGQAAMYLSRFTDSVHLVVRGDNLRKSMSSYLSERVEVNPRIHLRMRHELRAIAGEQHLERVELENTATGEIGWEDSRGIFIFIGATPCTGFLGEQFCKDEKGFLVTGADSVQCGGWTSKDRQPCALETSVPGVFAAGDCRSRTTKRVAFAVGDGALAVTCVHDFLGTYA